MRFLLGLFRTSTCGFGPPGQWLQMQSCLAGPVGFGDLPLTMAYSSLSACHSFLSTTETVRSKPPPRSQAWLFVPRRCEAGVAAAGCGALAGASNGAAFPQAAGSGFAGSIALAQKSAGGGNLDKTFPFGRLQQEIKGNALALRSILLSGPGSMCAISFLVLIQPLS